MSARARSILLAALALLARAPALADEPRDEALQQRPGANCRERYEAYLLTGYPRAFAASPTGTCGYAGGAGTRADAEALALRHCGSACSIVARSPDVPDREAATPAEMRPALRDPSFRHRGPASATGAVLWSHGARGQDTDARTHTAAFVRALNEAGWDVWRADRTEPALRRHEPARTHLDLAATRLREAGYSRLVLAGQSAGGWLSIEVAARRPDIEAAIALAPAIHGNRDLAGPLKDRALAEFDSLFARRANPATRLAVALFEGDDFDPEPARRLATLRSRARDPGWPLLLIDRPDGLAGHDAGRGVPFALRFRGCLARFVALPALAPGLHDCATIQSAR